VIVERSFVVLGGVGFVLEDVAGSFGQPHRLLALSGLVVVVRRRSLYLDRLLAIPLGVSLLRLTVLVDGLIGARWTCLQDLQAEVTFLFIVERAWLTLFLYRGKIYSSGKNVMSRQSQCLS